MPHKNSTDLTTLPSDYARVMLIELKASAKENAPLFTRYGGYGMEPLLRNGKERVNIQPVKLGFEPKMYDILAIEKDAKCTFRRFIRRQGDMFVVLGDSCRNEELVNPATVLGIVDEVKRQDGSLIMCGGNDWIKRSATSIKRRQRINRLKNLFAGNRIRYWAIAYFVILLISMWMPLSNIPLPDNFIFGLRPDHLFHASIYCFCAFFLMKLCWGGNSSVSSLKNILVWAGSVTIGLVTEFGQKLLPYRSFDINDLIANILGVSLGWMVLLLVIRLRRHNIHN